MHDDVDDLVPMWEANGVPAELIATLELSKRIARINDRIEQALRSEMTEYGLTYAEFDVLATLFRMGPPHRLTPSELTRGLFLTSGGLSNVLQRLTVAGHIARSANSDDGRSRWVQLTPDGRELAETVSIAAGRVHARVMAGAPPESIRRAADALREINGTIGRTS